MNMAILVILLLPFASQPATFRLWLDIVIVGLVVAKGEESEMKPIPTRLATPNAQTGAFSTQRR
jgi:hypothetical protein